MVSKEEVRALAQLARLRVSDSEIEGLQKDISNILEYVGQVGSIVPNKGETQVLRAQNVMREDILYGPATGLINKGKELLTAFPKREGDYAVVRKIIHKDE